MISQTDPSTPTKALSASEFMQAMRDSNLKEVRRALQAGFDVKSFGPSSEIWLHEACMLDPPAPEIVKELLAAGSVVDQKDAYGHSPLWNACETKSGISLEVVNHLLAAGANPNLLWSHHSLLEILVGKPDPDLAVIRRLLEAGANPNAKNFLGDIVLTHIGSRGWRARRLVALLMEFKVDLGQVCDRGYTALHWYLESASHDSDFNKKQWDVAATLIDAGAPLDVVNEKGQTPVQLAESLSKMSNRQACADLHQQMLDRLAGARDQELQGKDQVSTRRAPKL